MVSRLALQAQFAEAIREAMPPDAYLGAIELARAEGLDDKAIELAFHNAVAQMLGSPALALHVAVPSRQTT